ncbi:MAG: hypothetical protein C0404_01385 [Verrucomicrobia bacterium]|nr:hypothetical protein [Verrucomicrobiota bacterium]
MMAILMVGALAVGAFVLVRSGGRDKGDEKTTNESVSLPVGEKPLTDAAPAGKVQESTVTASEQKAVAANAKTLPVPAKKPEAKPDYSEKSRNYVAKLREIDGLGETLAPEQIQALYMFMDTSAKEQNMDADALCSVKNQALDKLLRQTELPAGIGERIVGMATNDKNEDLWRDYCVQHYSAYYDRKWPDDNLADVDGERKKFREVCWESVGLADGRIAGSALLCLERLGEKHDGFPKEKLAGQAWAIASSGPTTPANRVTAIQVAARLGSTNALQQARAWAESGDNVALRLSCIASVGQAGDKSDIPMLERLKSGKDPLVRKAAESAAKALHARLASR